ncbi:MAG: MASE1 domain-containing protein [Elusimicrobia bacterium]|nr:MASE1 domain-containing protein [Elusimicrobiota bacterium]
MELESLMRVSQKTQYFLRVVFIMVLYYFSAQAGLAMAIPPGHATTIWPPSGIALAAILIWGPSLWPGIWLGSFLANIEILVANNNPWTISLVIAAGSTLQALLAAWLIKRFIGSDNPFQRTAEVFKFIGIESAVCVVAATVGIASLCLGGADSWSNFWASWLTWWLGDLVGAIIVTPIALTWVYGAGSPINKERNLIEYALFILSVIAITQVIFGEQFAIGATSYPLNYCLIPLLAWAAFRFNQQITTMCIGIVSIVAIWGTISGLGLQKIQSLNESLLLMTAFIGVLAVTGLVLSAALTQQKKSDQDLQKSHELLEIKIQQKTGELVSANENLRRELLEHERIQETLKEQQKFQDALLKSLSAFGKGLAVIEAATYRFLFTNEAFCAIFGFSKDENFKISSFLDLVAPDELLLFKKRMEQKPPNHHPVVLHHEISATTKDGDRIHLEMTAGPFSVKGRRQIILIVQDITQRRKEEDERAESHKKTLLESEMRYRRLVELCPDAIIVHGEGKILYANDAAVKIVGAAHVADILGRAISELVHPDSQDLIVRHAKNLMEKPQATDFEKLKWRRLNGEVIFAEAASIPIVYKGLPAAQSVIRDITSRVRFQEELERAKETAEEASRAKSQFLATMSHELRTPLNSIIGFTNLLLKDHQISADESTALYLEKITANSKHLLNLINNILDLAKIESGKTDLDFSLVSLTSLINEVISGFETMSRDKGISLMMDVPPQAKPIKTDYGKLKQILINLVANALKFTSQGSVRVAVMTDPQTQTPARIDVIDTGIGIDPEKYAVIFEPFRQADSSHAREYGGTGLGLSICRSLCHALGYGIAVEGCPGKGSRFSIILSSQSSAQTSFDPKRLDVLEKIGGHQLIAKLINLFHQNGSGKMKDIIKGFQEKDAEAVKNASHSLKSSAANLGATGLQQIAAQIEQLAEEKLWPNIMELLPGLKQTFSMTQTFLEQQKRTGESIKKIAVIEDNPDNRLLARSMLEGKYEIDEYENGPRALESLGDHPPHLILLDVSLPGMDGPEVLRRIREFPDLKHTPTIALTAHAMAGDREKFLRMGFNDYLAKPISDEKILIDMIERLIMENTSTARSSSSA